jgi:hypothetical protein
VDQEVAKTLGELELKLQELERELTTVGHSDRPAEPAHRPGKLVDEAVERAGLDGDGVDDSSSKEAILVDQDAFGGPAVFGGEEVPSQGDATTERDLSVEVRETAYGEIPTPASQSTQPDSPSPPPTWLPSQPPSGSAPPRPAHSAATIEPSMPWTPGSPPRSPSPPDEASASTPPGMHPPSLSGGSQSPPPLRPDPRRPAAVEENRSVDLAELVRFRDKLSRTMEELIDEYSRLVSPESRSSSRTDV